MNEKDYRKICQCCDSVLLSDDSSLATVAIPWLHVIREHPVFVECYNDLFLADNKIKQTTLRFLCRFFRYFLGWVKNIFLSIFIKQNINDLQLNDLKNIDVLFVSHFVNDRIIHENDFYFGDCPNELVRNGNRACIALINHQGTTNYPFHITEKSCNSVQKILIPRYLNCTAEFRLFLKLFSESLRLWRTSSKISSELLSRVRRKAAQEALSGSARDALRLSVQIKSLVQNLNPKKIVVTYEGHAWERLAFAVAREENEKIKCIGYQHAVLFRLQHAIRRNLAGIYNPDIILTSGEIGKKQLASSVDTTKIPISVLGSVRVDKKNTITNFRNNREFKQDTNKLTCLVVPEAFFSECNILFEFSLKCALNNPELNFIWRLHPMVTKRALLSNNPVLKNLPKNIRFSGCKLEDDLNESQFVLYRGSTTVINSVFNGLRPIYLERGSELNIDPLSSLKYWRKNISTMDEFFTVVSEDSLRENTNNIDELNEAIDYCLKVFTPLDCEKILDLCN